MNKKLPKVKIDTIKLTENYYENSGYRYSAVKLIEHSKEFEVFDLPLIGINLSTSAWQIDNMDDFIHHAKRCVDTNLDHPIIIDHLGVICDGWHRVCKAIILGRTSIKAIRLETMPDYDSYKEPEKKD